MSSADVIAEIAEERRRQIETEGWTLEHDDAHTQGQMAAAAGTYALYSDLFPDEGQPPWQWPWDPKWWKPKDYRRDLIRAAALLVAEIERIDRAAEDSSDEQ